MLRLLPSIVFEMHRTSLSQPPLHVLLSVQSPEPNPGPGPGIKRSLGRSETTEPNRSQFAWQSVVAKRGTIFIISPRILTTTTETETDGDGSCVMTSCQRCGSGGRTQSRRRCEVNGEKGAGINSSSPEQLLSIDEFFAASFLPVCFGFKICHGYPITLPCLLSEREAARSRILDLGFRSEAKHIKETQKRENSGGRKEGRKRA